MKKQFTIGVAALLLASVGQGALAATISGTVRNPDGTPFRAAFVRAQNIKTKITMMVLSDSRGRYCTDRLDPGTYEVSATSVGYKSDPVSAQRRARRQRTGPSTSPCRLLRFSGSQLTKYQAGLLLPEAHGNGRSLIQQCFNCHAFGKIGAVGRHDRDGWKDEIDVMRQLGVARIKPEVDERVSEYLATAFGPEFRDASESPADLPAYQKVKQDRDYFSDEALNIVYVDYELTGDPRDRPGSARPDKDGNMWMEMTGGLSRLDPATGELKTWRLTNLSSNFIHEILPTADGSVWLTLEAQGGLARFDTEDRKVRSLHRPAVEPDSTTPSRRRKTQTIRSRTFPSRRDPGRRRAQPHGRAGSRRQHLGFGTAAEEVRRAAPANTPTSTPRCRTATASPSTTPATSGSPSSIPATTRTSAWST